MTAIVSKTKTRIVKTKYNKLYLIFHKSKTNYVLY